MLKLYRYERGIGRFTESYPDPSRNRTFVPGSFYWLDPSDHVLDSPTNHFRLCELPKIGDVGTPEQILNAIEAVAGWLDGHVAKRMDWHVMNAPDHSVHARDIVQPLIVKLSDAAVWRLGMADPPDDSAETLRAARVALNQIRAFATAKLPPPAAIPTKRTGRPRNQEPKGDLKVISALSKLHGYGCDNASVLKPGPFKTEEIADKAGVSGATVSRFMKRKWPGNAYAGYEADCTRDKIGLTLAKWQGDMSEEQFMAAVDEENRRRELDE
jgi:hypothetical protein